MEIIIAVMGGFIYLVMWGVAFELMSPHISDEHAGIHLLLSFLWWIILPIGLGCGIVLKLTKEKE